MEIKPLNLGFFSLLPIPDDLKNSGDITNEYLSIFHSYFDRKEGPRLTNYKERNYIISLDKILGGTLNNNYSVSFTTDIVVTIEDSGSYYDVIIDDLDEIFNFLNRDAAWGFSERYGEERVNRENYNVVDWKEEKSTFFLINHIK
jgi:hypothetical protein